MSKVPPQFHYETNYNTMKHIPRKSQIASDFSH